MKLSEKIFKDRKFPTVKASMFSSEQGYDVNSVELYLEELAIEIEKLENENERLKEENYAYSIKKEYVEVSASINVNEETQQEVAAKLAEPLEKENNQNKNLEIKYQERMEKLALKERSINRLLDAAQEDNLKIKREAKEQAKEIVLEAQEKATKILTEANMRCKEKENEIIRIENGQRELKERLINIQNFIGEVIK